MPRVAILCFDGCYLSCAAGFAELLGVANVHLRDASTSTLQPFDWCFVSEAGGQVATCGGLSIATEPITARDAFDVVLIPAIQYPGYKPFARFLDRLSDCYPWLRTQWENGAWIGANCTGTFPLAQSGLLDGRVATSTWWLNRPFRARYPKVDLQFRSVLTEADRILCAGATATYLLQTIRIIEHFLGSGVAAQCARTMLIDVSQTGRIPYLPLLAETQHGDALVSRAQSWLSSRMARAVTITELAAAVLVSERTLVRRFGIAVGQTPLEYLQSVRLQAARTLLEAGDTSVQSIAHQVGYQDASSFTRLFRREIGISPGAYRRRFHTGG